MERQNLGARLEKTAETKREWTTPRLRTEAKVVEVTLSVPYSGRG